MVLIDSASSHVAKRPFQFLDESNKLLQLSETLYQCELQIFANRGVNIAIVAASRWASKRSLRASIREDARVIRSRYEVAMAGDELHLLAETAVAGSEEGTLPRLLDWPLSQCKMRAAPAFSRRSAPRALKN
jgi:hypothetical protein